MWPFSKTKSTCMSGVLTCDGKHHTFAVWKDVLIEQTLYRSGMKEPLDIVTNGQTRTCVICHYTERRLIDED